MAPRQTQTYLRALFDDRGIAPRKSLGQNFLVDLNIHDTIVKTAAIEPGDVVLEIGSGTGALTALMAAQGAVVIAVEVDPAMAQLTTEAAANLLHVQVLHLDVLRNKNTLNPLVLDAVQAAIEAGSGRGFKLVANLPYHVATPVIINLLVHPVLCPALMVVTIQRELADRFCALPTTKPYGAVSVVVQALAEASIARSLPPSVFWPRPQVDSAVVMIRSDPAKRALVEDVAWFHEVVRRVFLHRRKSIRHALSAMWSDHWSKTDVDAWLALRGLLGQLRPEALNAEEFVALAHALHDEGRAQADPEGPPVE